MLILDVIIEYVASSLNRPFSYAYDLKQNVEVGMRVAVPFANKEIVGYVVGVRPMEQTIEEYKSQTGFEIKKVKSVIDQVPLFNDELMALSYKISSYYHASLISVLQAMLPPSLKPNSSSLNKAKIAYETYLKVDKNQEDGLTNKQKEILRLIVLNQPILKSEIKSSVIKTLIAKGLVIEFKKEKIRLVQEEIIQEQDKKLNEDQANALNEILTSDDKTFLLEGVTGSGKTEVYLQLCKKVVEEGKSVIILVPEISLTYQMVRNFKSRFKKIAILHSELSAGEKYDEYRRIARGDVNIVVGARSAIFAPLKNIGLIVIDEEHSETYKQESLPYYHALKVAEMRQEWHGFKIVLGSATPSILTKTKALKGIYHPLFLKERINKMILPKTEVVNMLDLRNFDNQSTIFSLKLRKEIQNTIDKKEQVILLLNRRGHSTYVSCRKCGKVMKCPNCSIPLTYHYQDQMLKCHHCGHVEDVPNECPSCHSTYLSKVGFGSEKVETEVKRLFPEARVLRLDSDISKIKSNTKNILQKFENLEADILIGTQVVSKGHNFKNVTLVGIVLADLGLAIPSYLAPERTFGLLTQTIGRAGRADKEGKAIIQTNMPNHYVIEDVQLQDYQRFFNQEMKMRKMNQYPPYTYLTIITLSCLKQEDVVDYVEQYKTFLEARFAHINVDVIGPSVPFISKMNLRYRRKIMLKYKKISDVSEVLDELIKLDAGNSKVQLSVNVDPYEDY